MTLQQTNDTRESQIPKIEKRIIEKIEDYERYDFTPNQDCALKTFFDLAQEFEGQRDFYSICVMIPKIFFNLEGALYLANRKGLLEMACHSGPSDRDPPKIDRTPLSRFKEQMLKDGSLFVPIKGNVELLKALPQVPDGGILGLFEVYPAADLSQHMRLFFEKYVNRIGFQLHNRIITQKNKEHLQFIHNLVNDIGHNVIVPNMYFKLFFRRMKGKIDRAGAIADKLTVELENLKGVCHDEALREIFSVRDELSYMNASMDEQFQQILSHYEQTSLFLETLLRRSHFEQGRYVIEPMLVNFKERIIRPQLNRYLPRLKERNISVDDQLAGIPDEEIMVVADAGIISQAYANLFSNAVKYTGGVYDEQGCPHKFVSLGMEILKDYFAEGNDGIKFNVFSTGAHISPEDVSSLFREGYRGKNVGEEYGTGHGLLF
ncbi:MAG: sensor histidine kinase, partial [Pseudomonadota bacterium]